MRIRWIVPVAAALLVAACGPTSTAPNTVIDGWSIGEPYGCKPEPGGDPFRRCDRLMPEALIGFDRRDPGHLPIVEARLHHEGSYRQDGRLVLAVRSGGCCSVAVFHLLDGSVRAIGIGYPGISDVPIAVDHGPDGPDWDEGPAGEDLAPVRDLPGYALPG